MDPKLSYNQGSVGLCYYVVRLCGSFQCSHVLLGEDFVSFTFTFKYTTMTNHTGVQEIQYNNVAIDVHLTYISMILHDL